MKWFVSLVLVAGLLAGCGEDIAVPQVIECKVCGKKVPSDGEACPNCSHPIADSVDAYKKAVEEVTEGEPFTITDLELEMLWCAPGTFTMGSPVGEANRDDDETQHSVTLTQGFWLGKHEVTQAQWQSIMGSNPSEFKGANLPVEQVSWNEVASFCAKLTERERKAGRLPEGYAYQLPTEAQWEYACRAGTKTAYSFGDTANLLYRHANYADKNTDYLWSDKSHDDGHANTASVGSYPANAWGFHDLHGNVYEWCQDWDGPYPSGSVRDPTGPADGSDRVLRGGSWGRYAQALRSANRDWREPVNRYDSLGFRPSLRLDQGKAK